MKYYVKFKWFDIQNEQQREVKEFETFEEARDFYQKIKKTTDELSMEYGTISEKYHPYNHIELIQAVENEEDKNNFRRDY